MTHHTNTFLYHGKNFAFPYLTVQETLDIKEEIAKGEATTVLKILDQHNSDIPFLNKRQRGRFVEIILHKERSEKKKWKVSSIPMIAIITKLAIQLKQGIDTMLSMRYIEFLEVIENFDYIFKDEATDERSSKKEVSEFKKSIGM